VSEKPDTVALRAMCEGTAEAPWVVGNGTAARLFQGIDGILCPCPADETGLRVLLQFNCAFPVSRDAAFVVAARNNWTALLDEVDRLRKLVQDVRRCARLPDDEPDDDLSGLVAVTTTGLERIEEANEDLRTVCSALSLEVERLRDLPIEPGALREMLLLTQNERDVARKIAFLAVQRAEAAEHERDEWKKRADEYKNQACAQSEGFHD